jgi:hypothetical protein
MASAVNDILDTNLVVRTGYFLPTGYYLRSSAIVHTFPAFLRGLPDAMKLAYLRRELEMRGHTEVYPARVASGA